MLRVEKTPLCLPSAFVVSLSGSNFYPVEESSFKIHASDVHF